MRGALVASVCVAAACGGDPAPARRVQGRALPGWTATPAGPGDPVVATVDGRPVYGSCVAAQAAVHARAADPRRAALDDCLALEVAAQEAERRGLPADPDVLDETSRVRAAALVDREFTARYRTVGDLPPGLVEDIFQRNARRMSRPEYRASFFMRIEVAGAPGTPDDQAAERTMRQAYDLLLAGRSDRFPDDVRAAVLVMARPGQKVSEGTPEPAVRDGILQPYYREPLFALASIGQVAAPVRGPYGWDLILYTDRIDPLERSRAEVLEELFPRIRMRWFLLWTGEMEKALGGERYYDDQSIVQLLGGDEGP